MKLLYRTAVVVSIILALLVVGPAWIPVESLRLKMEQAAAATIGAAVTISGVRLRLLPVPGISISGIAVCEQPERPCVVIRSGQVSVAILPLLSGQLQATAVSLQDIVVRAGEQAEGEPQRVVRMASLSGNLLKEGDGLLLPAWRASLYHGKVLVEAKISPVIGGKPVIKGTAHISDIQLGPLLRDVASEPHLMAALDADLHFSIRGGAEFKQQLSLAGRVHLHDGSLQGISLSGSLMAWLVHQEDDGSIPFEKLDLQLLVEDGFIAFRKIRLRAEKLAARGEVDIDPAMAVSGAVTASGLGGLLNVDLVLSGSLENPVISLAPPADSG